MNKRNIQRLQKIRQLPCVRCGSPAPSEACHSNFQQHGKGMGTKANDVFTIPMCRQCHQYFDHYQGIKRAEAQELFRQWLAITETWLAFDEQEYPF